MLSFLANPPPRTQTHSQTQLSLGDHYTCAFPLPTTQQTISSRQLLPPYRGSYTAFGTPPYHYHARQSETFTVESGALLLTLEEQKRTLTAGESATIAPGQYHTFRNASDDEDLQIVIELPRIRGVRGLGERFLRNTYSYALDCRRFGDAGVSIWQMLLFMWDADVFLAFPLKGVPRRAQKGISWVVMFVGGVVIGEKLLGYKRSYPEYYSEGKIEEVMDEGEKAEKEE